MYQLMDSETEKENQEKDLNPQPTTLRSPNTPKGATPTMNEELQKNNGYPSEDWINAKNLRQILAQGAVPQ
jgi:hypothetical protein